MILQAPSCHNLDPFNICMHVAYTCIIKYYAPHTLAMENFVSRIIEDVEKDRDFKIEAFIAISIIHSTTIYLKQFINQYIYIWITVLYFSGPWDDASTSVSD